MKRLTKVSIISIVLFSIIIGIFIKINIENTGQNKESNMSKYIGLGDSKLLELYVWKVNDNISYGLMLGTNRLKSEKEKLKLKENPVSLEELKEILETYSSGFSYMERIDDSISDEEFQEINTMLNEYSYIKKRNTEHNSEKKKE